MARDITDMAFNWMIEIFGWIFKMFFKIAWGIIKFVWNLVREIIAERKANSGSGASDGGSVSSLSDGDEDVMNYSVVMSNIVQAEESARGEMAENGGQLSQSDTLYFASFMTLAFSGNLSIREKFLLVEKINNSMESTLTQETIAKFYPKVITMSYDGLANYMDNSEMLMDHKNSFIANYDNKTLENFTDDFQNIFAYSLLLGNADTNITISSADFDDLDLPTPKYL